MKRLLIFLAVTFTLTWGVAWLAFFNPASPILYGGPVSQLLLAGIMLLPAVGTVLTVLITRGSWRGLMLGFRLRSCWRIYLLAWFAPAALTIVGTVVYFLLFPGRFDLTLSTMGETLQAQYDAADVPLTVTPALLWGVCLSQLLGALTWGPLVNMFFALGEELGWRGYMTPLLYERFSPRVALLLGGLIWGLWHAPIIALGHNYGVGYAGHPWLGIAAMCVFCVAMGAFLTALTAASRSVWPAALAHGALNAVAAFGIWFHEGPSDPFIGPAPTGIVGGAAFLAAAAYFFWRPPVFAPETPDALFGEVEP